MTVLFKEEQKFTQWWVWVILIIVGFLPFLLNYDQLFFKQEFEDRPISDLVFIVLSLALFGLIIMFLTMKLKTKIDQIGIEMKFSPFVSKKVKWSSIKSAEVLNYGFVGGWGIRPWTHYGTVYNIKGNKGLAIELFDGKKFLIGTQKEKELVKVMEMIRKKKDVRYLE
ncbi:MAG: hypothetical protein ACSHXF_02450 [Aquaticitalea sp.]